MGPDWLRIQAGARQKVCACVRVSVCVCVCASGFDDSAWVTALCRGILGKRPNTQSALCIQCSRSITCQLPIKWWMYWLMPQMICSYYFTVASVLVQTNFWYRMNGVGALSVELERVPPEFSKLWNTLYIRLRAITFTLESIYFSKPVLSTLFHHFQPPSSIICQCLERNVGPYKSWIIRITLKVSWSRHHWGPKLGPNKINGLSA